MRSCAAKFQLHSILLSKHIIPLSFFSLPVGDHTWNGRVNGINAQVKYSSSIITEFAHGIVQNLNTGKIGAQSSDQANMRRTPEKNTNIYPSPSPSCPTQARSTCRSSCPP